MGPLPQASARALTDEHGIQVVSASRSGRVVQFVVETSAIQRPVRVNVLLPRGYDTSRRRYPVVHLFHGTSGGAFDWLRQGQVIQAVGGRRVITVMPDAGLDGNGGSWFTDWLDQRTSLGRALWETFHVNQLVPWVDVTFRTRAMRSQRAVAGLSQGGFGAFSYAARHPDTFVAAASFSGAPDIAEHPISGLGGTAVVSATMVGLNGVQPFAPFGDPALHRIVWRGHNPASLVQNLVHTDLRLWSGNGLPGPYDRPSLDSGQAVAIERFAYESTTRFAKAAARAGVPYVFDDYGPGTHTWANWQRDVRQWLPHVMRVFAEDRLDPRRVDHRAVERAWAQWGWRVQRLEGPLWAWSRLSGADRDGFVWSGGASRIWTPRVTRPGSVVRVQYTGGSGPERVRADNRGRLVLTVRPTGPGPVHVRFERP